MGKENVGQGLGLAVILIGGVLSIIGLMNIFSELSAAPPTPDAIVEAMPTAAGPKIASITPPPATATANRETPQDELQNLLLDWRKAWASQDVAAYLAFYAADFQGNAATPEQWRANRKRILGQAKFIDIRIGKAEINLENDNVALITFPLDYASDRLEDHGTKALQVRRDNGKWLIEDEAFSPN